MSAALLSSISLVPPPVPNGEPEPVQMPVIDFSKLQQTDGSRLAVIRDVETACREIGCFQVINHGISKSVMERALSAANDFFKSPAQSKAEFMSPDITKPVRYDCSNEGINKSRSYLKHYAHPLEEWIKFWPREPPSYRIKMGQYAVEIRRVALCLMHAILQSLGLGQAYLGTKLEEGIQLLAVNSYPQSTQPGVTLGLAPHSDYGFITILLPSCPGLEVMDPKTKVWMSVQQPADTLHVHIGDHLEALSNGKYRTVVHRAALHSENSRVSIASIHGLAMNEKVRSAEELVDEQNPVMYKESSFRDFLDFLPSKETKNKSYIDSLRIDAAE
ncbi:2-oxoglutarate (2OG) and Fe(II)-dependent oxygenase superfamily protein [Rhynchospora pubera]|uniref:2-oxoglutarate (2OG) and Fe(II)-dependent oxygenase superfamily protein n=1 Tax=Rhynchospora pubera TaxID=906938 RepID=A0AAV8EC24_9POAL|nr:2-oxoglutarate (2OG) and Fe(II)-dependent oxygenase superfamily protein [Rhynchospora pubera]